MFRNATARMLVLFGLLISAGLVLAADRNDGVEAREARYSVTGFALNVLAITDHEEDKLYFYTVKKNEGAILDGVLDLSLVGQEEIPLTRTIPRAEPGELVPQR